jgi:hypothetical protein
MPAAPGGPGQHPCDALLRGQHETPEETTSLANAQRHISPRAVLQVVRRSRLEPCEIFFHGGAVGRCAARSAVNSADAHIANVRGRSPPVQLRTAYCARPTSPVAASQHRATVQRLPATGTTVSSTVTGGAHTTYAVSSVGALRLRRTQSHRRQGGCSGAARGSHLQSDQRGPWAPSPARNRHQPAAAHAARIVVTCGGRPARQT